MEVKSDTVEAHIICWLQQGFPGDARVTKSLFQFPGSHNKAYEKYNFFSLVHISEKGHMFEIKKTQVFFLFGINVL